MNTEDNPIVKSIRSQMLALGPEEPSLWDIADTLYKLGALREYEAYKQLIKIITPEQVRAYEQTT